MMLDRVQAVLDTLLAPDGVPVFFNRAKTVPTELSQTEYVVYTQSGSPPAFPADNRMLVRRPAISVRYLYDSSLEETAQGRAHIQARTEAILSAMEAAGFVSTTGILFLGDVDNVGKSLAVMEFDCLEFAP